MEGVRQGIPHYERHHCGHGIGLQIYDPPSISANSDQRLEEGMVLCVETPYYEIGKYGLQIEDTVVIVADGIRRLAHTSNKLIYL
jgi:Xaa-Pro aminopeptidase